ncbi:hypothetical protein SH528x_003844 [Novipirellula sp. SH528]|uniref:hypothetical protein n=1 Tax=Novipirellula sp. SH528 TaxID=3454466 RepID=UPI003F9FD491
MPNTNLSSANVDFLQERGLPTEVVAAAEEAYLGFKMQMRQFKRQQTGRGSAEANLAAKKLTLGLFEHLRKEAESYLDKHAPCKS